MVTRKEAQVFQSMVNVVRSQMAIMSTMISTPEYLEEQELLSEMDEKFDKLAKVLSRKVESDF